MQLFVLVMDQYDGNPQEWLYSRSHSTRAVLETLVCYSDPPNSLPRADFQAVDSWKLATPLPPCDRPGSPPVGGTIYLLQPRA